MKTYSELKTNARNKIEPHKSKLYGAAAIFIAIQVIFTVFAFILELFEFSTLSSAVDSIGSIILYPVILANIAMVANIYLDKEQTGAFENFTSLRKFGRSLWAYIYPSLLILLWSLPFVVVMGISVVMMETGITIAAVILLIISVIGMITLGVYKTLQYALSPFMLGADENLSVTDSIKKSTEYMKGHKARLFGLNLSFIGWYILTGLTLGLLMIWLLPYYNATVYEFYLELEQEKNPKNLLEKTEEGSEPMTGE